MCRLVVIIVVSVVVVHTTSCCGCEISGGGDGQVGAAVVRAQRGRTRRTAAEIREHCRACLLTRVARRRRGVATVVVVVVVGRHKERVGILFGAIGREEFIATTTAAVRAVAIKLL